MRYSIHPPVAELRRARPNFSLKVAKAWNHRDNLQRLDRLTNWLIWNTEPFDIKVRFAYLAKYKGVDTALENLAKKLDAKNFGVYFGDREFYIWKPASEMPVKQAEDSVDGAAEDMLHEIDKQTGKTYDFSGGKEITLKDE